MRNFMSYPLRTCGTMHACSLCGGTILCGQQYRDGGYGRRGHVACVAKLGQKKVLTPKERLAEIARIIEAVDNRCAAADGDVTPTLQEMTQAEISRIYELSSGTKY